MVIDLLTMGALCVTPLMNYKHRVVYADINEVIIKERIWINEYH